MEKLTGGYLLSRVVEALPDEPEGAVPGHP
jgi:hypothetical protein